MIRLEIIKEIIATNKDFIKSIMGKIIARENIVFPAKAKKVKVIYGVRRSGKTFILYDVFRKTPENSLYIDFEDERLAGCTVKDMDKIKDAFFSLHPESLNRKEIVFLFDEIQNVPSWEKYARRITERESLDVYVTGSSAAVAPYKLRTLLRGRSWGIRVFPFSFKEVLNLKGLSIPTNLYDRNKISIKNAADAFLQWGGFPEVVLSQSIFEKRKLLDEYLDAMFFKDVIEQFKITNIVLHDTLKQELFSNFASKFSCAAFYRRHKEQFHFSKDKLYEYYNNFLESMLLYEVQLFTRSAHKRARNPGKVYLVDTGLARHVSGTDKGRLLENVVFIELKRRGYDIYYYEEEGECDFIVQWSNGEMSVFQVTFEITESNRAREINGLLNACKKLELSEGTVITYDDEDSKTIDDVRITVIPFWKWAVL